MCSFPLDALIAVTALESQRHRCLVVGEDLGTVPDGLREQLAAADIFSYRVLWFERDGQGFKPPEAYPAQALACLASHDLPTFSGWRAGRDIEIARAIGQIAEEDVAGAQGRARRRSAPARCAGGCGRCGRRSPPAPPSIGLVASTPSQIMLVQADDLAGEADPLNVPGTDREWPNWRRRVSVPVEELGESRARAGHPRSGETGAAGMTKRVIIEKVEPLSHRWVKLDRYTIRYTRQDGTHRHAGARGA